MQKLVFKLFCYFNKHTLNTRADCFFLPDCITSRVDFCTKIWKHEKLGSRVVPFAVDMSICSCRRKIRRRKPEKCCWKIYAQSHSRKCHFNLLKRKNKKNLNNGRAPPHHINHSASLDKHKNVVLFGRLLRHFMSLLC